jgi:hypothetical protein
MNPDTEEELTQNLREAQTMNESFWKEIFEKTNFESYIEKRFKIATKNMMHERLEE